MRTKEQLDQYTDLYIIPNATNQPGASGLAAAASGSVYFDDGVNVTKNVSAFDITYSFNEDDETVAAGYKMVIIRFNERGDGYKDPNNARQEKIGNITIFNPGAGPQANVLQLGHESKPSPVT